MESVTDPTQPRRLSLPSAQFLWVLVLGLALSGGIAWADASASGAQTDFPPSLDDYAVTYTLVVTLEDAKQARATRSELSENIQDAFNEVVP